MHEILFRGKMRDDGKWVYGYYCNCVHDINGGKTYPAIQQTDDGSLYFREVIPDTIGQYIGLTSNHGKSDGRKIFEGDIVNLYSFTGKRDKRNAVVQWDSLCMQWTLGGSCMFSGDILEVVGNVYDNPELAGGADNV